MSNRNYSRYFRVFKNDTVVTEVPCNDFRPLKFKPMGKNWLIANTTDILFVIAEGPYNLRGGDKTFIGYPTRAKAMQMAKAGALSYIDSLIALGDAGIAALLKYRMDHYEDLHFNLIYANIDNVKRAAEGLQPVIIPTEHSRCS